MLRYPAPDHPERPAISRRAWLTTATGVTVAAGLVKTQFDAASVDEVFVRLARPGAADGSPWAEAAS